MIRHTGRLKQHIIIFACATALLAVQTQAEEVWEAELRVQLMDKMSCELTLISDLKAEDSEGQVLLKGRAHCADGRAFDFARRDPTADFNLTSCEVQTC